MAGSPPAPPSATQYATWLPRDIPYNELYEDSVAAVLLSGSAAAAPPALPARTDPSPALSIDDLPVPLSDPRRIHPSAIPGIPLTSPRGYFEGGPGMCPTEDEFARHFVAEHRVRGGAEGLRAVVARETRKQLEVARERARARVEAKARNEAIAAEVKEAADQMELEMKVLNKARERARERKERRDAKRKVR